MRRNFLININFSYRVRFFTQLIYVEGHSGLEDTVAIKV